MEAAFLLPCLLKHPNACRYHAIRRQKEHYRCGQTLLQSFIAPPSSCRQGRSSAGACGFWSKSPSRGPGTWRGATLVVSHSIEPGVHWLQLSLEGTNRFRFGPDAFCRRVRGPSVEASPTFSFPASPFSFCLWRWRVAHAVHAAHAQYPSHGSERRLLVSRVGLAGERIFGASWQHQSLHQPGGLQTVCSPRPESVGVAVAFGGPWSVYGEAAANEKASSASDNEPPAVELGGVRCERPPLLKEEERHLRRRQTLEAD